MVAERFVLRPPVYKALLWNGDNFAEVAEFVGEDNATMRADGTVQFFVAGNRTHPELLKPEEPVFIVTNPGWQIFDKEEPRWVVYSSDEFASNFVSEKEVYG